MKFSVVIVNYNVKYYLEQCLCSLYRAIDNLDRKSTRLNSSHMPKSRMPSSA